MTRLINASFKHVNVPGKARPEIVLHDKCPTLVTSGWREKTHEESRVSTGTIREILVHQCGGQAAFEQAVNRGAIVEGNDGLTDLIKLLASLEIGSTCQAVVGNSESEVTELLVLANCVRRGVCPPVHSMNGSPLQAFAGVIVDGRASSVDRAFDKFLPSS